MLYSLLVRFSPWKNTSNPFGNGRDTVPLRTKQEPRGSRFWSSSNSLLSARPWIATSIRLGAAHVRLKREDVLRYQRNHVANQRSIAGIAGHGRAHKLVGRRQGDAIREADVGARFHPDGLRAANIFSHAHDQAGR